MLLLLSKEITNENTMKQKSKAREINKLAMMLGISGLDGAIILAALAGLFKWENVFIIAILFLAGPGAILTASLLDGTSKQRMLIALVSGIIATIIIILSAGIGPLLFSFLNINVVRIFGGIAIGIIGLMIVGVKIPDTVPFGIMILGFIGGFVLR